MSVTVGRESGVEVRYVGAAARATGTLCLAPPSRSAVGRLTPLGPGVGARAGPPGMTAGRVETMSVRRRPLALAAAVAAAGAAVTPAAWAGTAGPTGTRPAAGSAAGLRLTSTVTSDGGRLVHLSFTTPDLPGFGNATDVDVLLPPGYTQHPATRYPVVYLLHGAGDTYASWSDPSDGDIAALEDGTKVGGRAVDQLITVMPDGGQNPARPRISGWYSDWVGSDVAGVGAPRWEDYLIGQLVPWVDANYRTIPDRTHRVIAGLSMGGYGAMDLAARHPDLFGIAGSFSGAVDIADGGPPEAAAFDQLHSADGTPDANVWGSYSADEVNWRDHNPPDLAANLSHTLLFTRNGTGVPGPADNPQDSPLEGGVAAMNAVFRARLAAAGVACQDCQVTPTGTHSWPYWRADMVQFLTDLPGWIGSASAGSPASFDYRSARPAFEVYGWRVTADPHRAAEFLDLSGVSAGGFQITGSGLTTVSTPPRTYRPGQRVQVAGTGAGGTRATVRAGADGSLTVAVDLGPAHQAQEYTTAGDLAGDQLPGYFTTDRVTLTPA